jgi:hypothetical protein
MEARTSRCAMPDPPGALGETPMAAEDSRTWTTVTTTTTTRLEKPLRATPCLRSQNIGANKQTTGEVSRESPQLTSILRIGSPRSERGEGPAPPLQMVPPLPRSDPRAAPGVTRTAASTPEVSTRSRRTDPAISPGSTSVEAESQGVENPTSASRHLTLSRHLCPPFPPQPHPH